LPSALAGHPSRLTGRLRKAPASADRYRRPHTIDRICSSRRCLLRRQPEFAGKTPAASAAPTQHRQAADHFRPRARLAGLPALAEFNVSVAAESRSPARMKFWWQSASPCCQRGCVGDRDGACGCQAHGLTFVCLGTTERWADQTAGKGCRSPSHARRPDPLGPHS
jgi:hypothetical protein